MTFGNIETSYGNGCAIPTALKTNIYVVPIHKSMGYDALTHQQPLQSSQYFNIQGAYPDGCTTFGYRRAESSTVMHTFPANK